MSAIPSREGTGARPPAARLPASWSIVWGLRGGPQTSSGARVLVIDRKAVVGHESTSMAFWRDRLTPWANAEPPGIGGGWPPPGVERTFPLGKLTIHVREFPALDELWTLWMWACCERGEDLDPAWEAMCLYAADVRQGMWLDRVPAQHAVQAVYLAIAQHFLLGPAPNRAGMLAEVFQLFQHVGRRLAEGARLLDDDLLVGVPAFERYVRLLAADERLYQEDRQRGQRFLAELPASEGSADRRRLGLLVLRQPAARQFKLWARVDPQAPGGHGYPLLLVKLDKDQVVLSADPVSRATVGWLAKGLSAREATARAGAAEAAQPGSPSAAPAVAEGKVDWYDGRDHAGTLLAAPEGGTRIPFDTIVEHLEGALDLAPVKDDVVVSEAPPRSAKRSLMAGVAAVAIAALALAGVAILQPSRPSGVGDAASPASPSGAVMAPPTGGPSDREPAQEEPTEGRRSGAKGDPLKPDEVVKLIDSDDGFRAIKNYALIAGVCSYTGDRELRAPCRDARAVRDLLIRDYGYKREQILFLIDDKPEPGETIDGAPTAEGLKLAVEKFRERLGNDDRSSFLFYYSGHGGYIKGAQKDYGILQPSGFFSKFKDQPYEHRGWDMHKMVEDIKKGVPSKHIMLVLDCCYAGWAGAKGDDDLETTLGTLWKERAEVVLSAGAKGQRAWEDEVESKAWVWDGHSAMTAFLLAGLKKGSDGVAAADKNQDHVVTDEELAMFVRGKVPPSVAEFKQKAQQTPQFFRLDQNLTKSGQFLFVPAK